MAKQCREFKTVSLMLDGLPLFKSSSSSSMSSKTKPTPWSSMNLCIVLLGESQNRQSTGHVFHDFIGEGEVQVFVVLGSVKPSPTVVVLSDLFEQLLPIHIAVEVYELVGISQFLVGVVALGDEVAGGIDVDVYSVRGDVFGFVGGRSGYPRRRL